MRHKLVLEALGRLVPDVMAAYNVPLADREEWARRWQWWMTRVEKEKNVSTTVLVADMFGLLRNSQLLVHAVMEAADGPKT